MAGIFGRSKAEKAELQANIERGREWRAREEEAAERRSIGAQLERTAEAVRIEQLRERGQEDRPATWWGS